ncbi:MAG: class B sortase [Eubacteriales bacterium]|nr:class B sortase [Eubacteriales bacterium]
MKQNRKKRRAGSVLRTMILIIALGVFCFSAYKLVSIYLDYKQGSDEYSALERYADLENPEEPDVPEEETQAAAEPEDGVVVTGSEADSTDSTEEASKAAEEDTEAFTYETETDSETGEVKKKKIYYMKNPVDFESLQAINEDIIGWLKVGALDISYPVTQGEDNEYYLHRTFEGVENFAGCIFMDYLNDVNFQDDNTIIYGHNMKDGSMFGTLRKFLEDGVYDSDHYFWIYTPTRIYKYEIFNCTTVGTVSSTYNLNFGTRTEFQDYLDVAMMQSQVDTADVEVTSSDKIVTLSTCTGDETTRFVVQGKLVRTYAAK